MSVGRASFMIITSTIIVILGAVFTGCTDQDDDFPSFITSGETEKFWINYTIEEDELASYNEDSDSSSKVKWQRKKRVMMEYRDSPRPFCLQQYSSL